MVNIFSILINKYFRTTLRILIKYARVYNINIILVIYTSYIYIYILIKYKNKIKFLIYFL